MSGPFKFALGDKVSVNGKAGSGTVEGRQEHIERENAYLVLFYAAENPASPVRNWWDESSLSSATPGGPPTGPTS